MTRLYKWTAIVLSGLIGLLVLATVALYPFGMQKLTQSFADIAVETVNIPTDSGAAARGKHVAIVWTCTRCHGENLAGTLVADDPIQGTIPASNLTLGKGGVARSYTDADWIRAIRHGVKQNYQVEVFMYGYYSTMSDRDLGDLIAYLKQLPPADSDNPKLSIGPGVAVASAVGLYTPMAELVDHGAPRPADPVPGVTEGYGRYLSAICVECHGNYVAGKVEKWSQEDLIRSFRTGVSPSGKQLGPTMSSKTFKEMNDMELAALWLYLQNTSPVRVQK